MNTINWDAVSGMAEVIGVIAVLLSILYLARQVSQGNKLNQADSVRAFLGQYNSFLYEANDPAMLDIWRRGFNDFNALSPAEQTRLHFVLLSHYMLGQAQRMVDPQGTDPLSQTVDYIVAATVRQRGFKTWWDTFKITLPDRRYVDHIDRFKGVDHVDFAETMLWFLDGPG